MLKIVKRRVQDLKPYANNPRLNASAVDAVAASIQKFGYRNLIVIDGNDIIINGDTRQKALLKLGWDEIDVILADDLTPDQVKALRIADNRTGEIAEWDMEKLVVELLDLKAADFDLSVLAFDDTELIKILNGDAPKTGQTDPDDAPALPDVPVSRLGAIYRLGNHRLMCGDSTKAADIQALMQGRNADFWLTDPPYNVNYEGEHGLTIQNDNMEDKKFRAFLVDAFKTAVSVMKPGSSFYIFHADSEGYNFRGACRDVGIQVRQCLIWVKNSLVLGRQDFHWMHEPVLYGWKDGAAHNWYSDRSQTTVMHFNKPQKSELHPTMKPVEMLIYLIKNSSKSEDIVLDSFGGSGSTVIAAEQMGRIAFVMELGENYCDVIRKRWAEFVHGPGCDWENLTPEVKIECSN